MILLSATMFILGVLAFTDAIFNYGNMFRMIFSSLLIVLSVLAYLKTRDLNDWERLEVVSANGQSKNGEDEGDLIINTENSEKKPEKVHI